MDATKDPPTGGVEFENPPAKRQKMDTTLETNEDQGKTTNGIIGEEIKSSHQTNGSPVAPKTDHRKGEAPIKPEYLIPSNGATTQTRTFDDDAAEGSTLLDSGSKAAHVGKDDRKGKREKNRGQNKDRQFGTWGDTIQLCKSRAYSDERSPADCQFGEKCRLEHDLRKYLNDGKREDLTTFDGKCPIWDVRGICPAGWKCRFVGSHSREIDKDDGIKELVLLKDEEKMKRAGISEDGDREVDIYNIIPLEVKKDLSRRKIKTAKADAYADWAEKWSKDLDQKNKAGGKHTDYDDMDEEENGTKMEPLNGTTVLKDDMLDNRASYISPPFLPSEKRRLYYGPDTPILAPLTTQGNLPFRRLCISLGAQVTWSEMAMALPLIQGEKSEWALMKAHATEVTAPTLTSASGAATANPGYEHGSDLRFGAQLAANKPWQAYKATEIVAAQCPRLRAIDLNCGCPIDLVYRAGAGAGLLDAPARLEKMLRGMNAVSGAVPVSAKIRMGGRSDAPCAARIVERLVLGGRDSRGAGLGGSGVAAIALHGRSRQQRYTKLADWHYIAEIGSLITRLNEKKDEVTDTVREVDDRERPNGSKVFFVGNGDVYSHVDYYDHLDKGNVDAAMVARGALIKPWIFEEIATQQYLDKSASERLTYIEQFVRNGLECWGSDEMGVGTTRRFLLEWLSFSCRYVPIGILERLPPRINERPPPYRGRNELETLLASDNYKDWIKIRYVELSTSQLGGSDDIC